MELYDLGEKVECVIKTDIARAFVDLNRSLQDMPPNNPDGLIKSKTCYDKPIYTTGKEPDEALITLLIEMYYLPYHRRIQQNIKELDLQLCLDCHSMAATAPYFSPDQTSSKRPMFCLSNQDGKTCSNEMMERLADCIAESYQIDRNEISFNDPFHGGYITKTYGYNPIPWIQIEMNRDLYLSEKWFHSESFSFYDNRLQELNKMFENTISSLSKKLGW